MTFVRRVLLIAITALFCAWALREWCLRPYACDVAMTEITASTSAVDDLRGDYARVQRAEHNIARLHALETQCRTDLRLYVLLGGNESVAGRHEQAVSAYEKALTLDRRPEIYIALAAELLQLGRIDDAVASYVTAGRFSPGTFDAIPSDELTRRVREELQQHP